MDLAEVQRQADPRPVRETGYVCRHDHESGQRKAD